MQQIRINRTPALNKVLSFLKERYSLLSEAEIIKMVLSKQYDQETQQLDPSKKFTDEEWNRGFRLMDKARENASKYPQEEVEEAINQAVHEVRAEKAKKRV